MNSLLIEIKNLVAFNNLKIENKKLKEKEAQLTELESENKKLKEQYNILKTDNGLLHNLCQESDPIK